MLPHFRPFKKVTILSQKLFVTAQVGAMLISIVCQLENGLMEVLRLG